MRNNIFISIIFITLLNIVLLSSIVLCVPAFAVPLATTNQGDYFSRVTNPTSSSSTSKLPTFDPKDPNLATHWFDVFDEQIDSHSPTPTERAILTQPFNQSAERVNRWILTAQQVAKEFRQLATNLQQMQVPAKIKAVAELRDLTVDWYSDAALVYEDLIRPRRACKTKEELDAVLQQFKNRSDALAESNNSLHSLDTSLRRTFGVHLALRDDPIQQFVQGK